MSRRDKHILLFVKIQNFYLKAEFNKIQCPTCQRVLVGRLDSLEICSQRLAAASAIAYILCNGRIMHALVHRKYELISNLSYIPPSNVLLSLNTAPVFKRFSRRERYSNATSRSVSQLSINLICNGEPI